MGFKILLFATILAVIHASINGQFNQFRGLDLQPIPPYTGSLLRELNRGEDGSSVHSFGYEYKPAWATISQKHTPMDFTLPMVFKGGLDFNSEAGHKLGGSFSLTPGEGGHGTLNGQVTLINDKTNSLNAFVQHDRALDQNLRPIGPETNSAGLNYMIKDGASAFLSARRTNGGPVTGNIGGSVPVFQNDDLKVSITGSTGLGNGKPVSNFGVNVEVPIK